MHMVNIVHTMKLGVPTAQKCIPLVLLIVEADINSPVRKYHITNSDTRFLKQIK
jgi:hypothetical protein